MLTDGIWLGVIFGTVLILSTVCIYGDFDCLVGCGYMVRCGCKGQGGNMVVCNM